MRIIAGSARGRRIDAPRTSTTRPMTDRAREGLFSAIATFIPGADVVDLYAGSGSLGLEALSRGAASVTFIEQDRAASEALVKNIERVGLGGTLRMTAVERFLDDPGGPFDVAFVDPPYAASLPSVSAIMRALVPCLRPGGLVVLHRPTGEERPLITGLEPAGERAYGTTQLWRYEKEAV